MTSRIIFCQKQQQNAPGLTKPPYPGPIGQRVFEHISADAWKMWQRHQVMLINEYRLNLLEPAAKTFLEKEMEKFLFGEGSDKPPGYTPTD